MWHRDRQITKGHCVHHYDAQIVRVSHKTGTVKVLTISDAGRTLSIVVVEILPVSTLTVPNGPKRSVSRDRHGVCLATRQRRHEPSGPKSPSITLIKGTLLRHSRYAGASANAVPSARTLHIQLVIICEPARLGKSVKISDDRSTTSVPTGFLKFSYLQALS